MQLRASHAKFSEKELIRVQFVADDLYYVLFENKSDTATNSIEFRLTLAQLRKLHMMVGIMIPGTENEDRSL